MRLTILQPQLLRLLQLVEHAVNDRSTLPILANVLLQTKEGELTLTTTDLDVGIQCRLPLTTQTEQGAIALPARKLSTIIRELPEDVVTLETKKNHTATVLCGQASFRISGLPPEDFPLLPEIGSAERITLAGRALKTLLDHTVYAMSTEETRFILNGALVTAQRSGVTVAATDGRRLAVATVPTDKPTQHTLQAVIPTKTVRELQRLLQHEDHEEVSIALLKDNQLGFQCGGATIVTRLLEGQFPNYEAVVPPPSKSALTCDRHHLINAIRRAGLMASPASQAVVLTLSAQRLVVTKESPELGSARDELAATYTGEPMTVAFNPEYLLDVLKVLEEECVTIELSAPDRPAVIRLPGFLYLVLPMKLA